MVSQPEIFEYDKDLILSGKPLGLPYYFMGNKEKLMFELLLKGDKDMKDRFSKKMSYKVCASSESGYMFMFMINDDDMFFYEYKSDTWYFFCRKYPCENRILISDDEYRQQLFKAVMKIFGFRFRFPVIGKLLGISLSSSQLIIS